MLLIGISFQGESNYSKAMLINSSCIGQVYSETENGESVVGVKFNVDDSTKTFGYSYWKYNAADGWKFQHVNVEGEYETNEQALGIGKYVKLLQPVGANYRFVVYGNVIKEIMPEFYKIETIGYQRGEEISREYEYSYSNAADCISSEHSLQLTLLQNVRTVYGGSAPQEISYVYNIYSGLKMGKSGDVVLNAAGANIVGEGAAFYKKKKYIVEFLPVAVKPQDKYRYEFAGWYTKAEGGEKIEIGSVVEKDQQLYAHWNAIPVSYKVTCTDVLENDYGTVLGAKTWNAEYGDVVSGNMIGSDSGAGTYYIGREYSGCSTAKVGVNGAEVYRYFRNSNMTVICEDLVKTGPDTGTMLGTNIWEAPYTSIVSGAAVGSKTEIGAYYPGYQYVASTIQKVENGGCTVYRYFLPIIYDIEFVSNCASGGSMARINNCYYGHNYTLTKNSFINRSKITLDCNAQGATCDTAYQYVYHEFAGWADAPEGEVKYSDQCSVSSLCNTSMVKRLYAVWSDKEAVISAQPKRLGYEFVGWSKNPDATTGKKQFQVSEDETLYAVWKPAPVKYQVQYYKQNMNKSFELAAEYEHMDYTGGEIILEEIEDIYPGFWLDSDSSRLKGTVKADGSLVLSAYFRRGEYSISFDFNGGKSITGVQVPEKITGLYEEKISIPNIELYKEGYDFAGWGIKPDSKQAIAKSGENFLIPNHNQVLYAVWIPRHDTVFSVIPYYENVSGTGYIQGKEVKLYGETDSTVEEGICSYYNSELDDSIEKMFGKGYQLASKIALERKYILADGTTSVELYLNRKRYQFVFGIEHKEAGEDSVEESVLYGQIYCFPVNQEKLGIQDIGYYKGTKGEIYYPGDIIQVTNDACFYIVTDKDLPRNTIKPQITDNPMQTKTPDLGEDPKESSLPVTNNTSEASPTPETTQEPKESEIPQGNGDNSILLSGISTTPNPEEVSAVLEKNKAKILPKKGKRIVRGTLVYSVKKSTLTKKTVKITGIKKAKKKIVIPSTISINGYDYQVTEIGKNAFSNQKKLQEVVIGENIKKIGKNAFSDNRKLKNIVIKAKNIKKIGKDVWKDVAKSCRFQYSAECSMKSRRLFQKAYQGK